MPVKAPAGAGKKADLAVALVAFKLRTSHGFELRSCLATPSRTFDYFRRESPNVEQLERDLAEHVARRKVEFDNIPVSIFDLTTRVAGAKHRRHQRASIQAVRVLIKSFERS